ncbi:MAG: Soluble aldose sugar dehydrogenase YliI precursor, partial [Planctomycetota bacterium]
MRFLPSLLPLLTAVVLPLIALPGQDAEPAELPAGPAIEFAPAFPAQEPFDRPLFVAFTDTDPEHAYVVTQPGWVFAIPRDGSKATRRTFLDVSKKVLTENWEEGLLGFQFDPEFAKNGFVYVCWSERIEKRSETMGNGKPAQSNRQSVISRFGTTNSPEGRIVDMASELRLLEVYQPFGNHNGGTIVFGPDGMLYLALGDGGAANDPFGNAQVLTNLLGKVSRIDVRGASKEAPYKIPADNPFVGKDGARGEIWCYGLRNPWRIAFDRQTGDLWCGDVGQNRIEEVDRLVRGANYGWNVMEADEVFKLRKETTPAPAGMVAPVAQYGHDQGLSITGGHVYRGSKIPGLQGWFVYGDFMTLRMWACKED